MASPFSGQAEVRPCSLDHGGFKRGYVVPDALPKNQLILGTLGFAKPLSLLLQACRLNQQPQIEH